MGIYIGHKTDECFKLNWLKKLESIEMTLNHWKRRNLSLFGKVQVIKQFALSKIVFPATILCVPEVVKKQLKKLVFLYLWGKRDKVKRSTIINNINRGGLNMVDIDSFLEALKASWVPRIINNQGKWRANFMQISQKLNISLNYLLNMTFKKIDSIPVISHMNPFCREVLTAYNKCKTIKEFKLLSTNEILQQPLWGNE